MKIPTEKEIIDELVILKEFMKSTSVDFQMGVGKKVEDYMINKLNKIIRMVRNPCRRIDMRFVKDNQSEGEKNG